MTASPIERTQPNQSSPLRQLLPRESEEYSRCEGKSNCTHAIADIPINLDQDRQFSGLCEPVHESKDVSESALAGNYNGDRKFNYRKDVIRMFRNKNTKTHKLAMTATEAEAFIQGHLVDGYTVTVPEQNPMKIGADTYFRVALTDAKTGGTQAVHISTTEPNEGAQLKVRDIRFSANPFKPAIQICEVAAL